MGKNLKDKFKANLRRFFASKKAIAITCTVIVALVCVIVTFVMLAVKAKTNNEQVAADEITEVIQIESSFEEITLETVETEATTQEVTTTETPIETEAVASASDYIQVTNKTGSPSLDYDTTGPVFLSSDEVSVVVGSDFNLDQLVSYGDYYDACPNLSYSGYVDTNTLGSYSIVAKLTDASGNETTKNMTINVVSSKPSETDNRTRINYSDFMATYAADNVHFGIDVSRWQGTIDFNAVKAAGAEFVIIRIGGWDGSELYRDSCYDYNIKAAKEAGLKVGVYFHSNDNTVSGMTTHSQQLLSMLDGVELDFPVAFDWESWSRFQKYNMSFQTLNQLFYTFHDTLAAGGYSTMLYSSKYYLENFWDNVYNYPVWLANYVTHTSYVGSYSIWQVNNIGRIDGVGGDVDLDIYYGSFN
ncbi:GH25 family lysozyme [Lachnospira multipara]|uniref:GH25 family lysozyme n=1 Tax=Lachnospira multipara TaxID=28051 RepID=UPI0003F5F145|nr:GH25 family lysozyme [Lachnospira multipara]